MLLLCTLFQIAIRLTQTVFTLTLEERGLAPPIAPATTPYPPQPR